jgi:hypothetical protein
VPETISALDSAQRRTAHIDTFACVDLCHDTREDGPQIQP